MSYLLYYAFEFVKIIIIVDMTSRDAIRAYSVGPIIHNILVYTLYTNNNNTVVNFIVNVQ